MYGFPELLVTIQFCCYHFLFIGIINSNNGNGKIHFLNSGSVDMFRVTYKLKGVNYVKNMSWLDKYLLMICVPGTVLDPFMKLILYHDDLAPEIYFAHLYLEYHIKVLK